MNMENFNSESAYLEDAEVVLKKLSSSSDGLSEEESISRKATFGSNDLVAIKKELLIVRFGRQFKDLMIILLLVSAGISLYFNDLRTGIVLIILVLFNTLIGFFQEYRAEKLMDSLSRLVKPEAKVKRLGVLTTINRSDLVIGDVVYVEEGDSIPADLRILSESELSTNDFALTGESNPTRKFTHAIEAPLELALRHNLLFMGTTIATGHGEGVVIATSMKTELGRIATLSQATHNETSPLQKEINHIAKRITQGTILLCVPLFFIALKAKIGGDSGDAMKAAFLFAIGVASSLIPQGLPAEISTSLAQAANKLAKAKALVKKLSAVETLGSTSIILTDKTGTLTKNEMTVQQLLIGLTPAWVTGIGYGTDGQIVDEKGIPASNEILKQAELMMVCGAFASNARVKPPDNDHPDWYVIGDPTEGALITLSCKAGYDPQILDDAHPEIKEHCFDSARKRMSSIRHYNDKLLVFAKGAPESILERCTHILTEGDQLELTEDIRLKILERNDNLAGSAMRNLALAYKELDNDSNPEDITLEQAESKLVFLGMSSMLDPPREEIPETMLAARTAHIPVCIVTGDNALTAKAIAIKAGLAARVEQLVVVNGKALKELSDQNIAHLLRGGSIIFSRVAPEDKLRIVELAKSLGLIVAVTGDGINDAPALKRADIGVAMGKTGTDVAKQSASLILLDDSFKTLVGAIQEGRIIFQNIKKGALSCFTSNTAELFVNLLSLGAAVILHIPIAIGVMQILAIDLIAELFPIAALGSDGAEQDLMSQKPRRAQDHILNKHSIFELMWIGLIIGSMAYSNYLLVFWRAGVRPEHYNTALSLYARATTVTYLTIVMCQLGNILQRRSPKGLFTRFQFTNRKLWIAMSFSMFCVLNISYNPLVSPYFSSAPLQFADWFYALGAMTIFLGIRELQLFLSRTSAD